jgi:peroxiredoxin
MRSDIITGATFPDYELPDQTGTRRRLSELQGDDPMILVLSRGHFCPKDRRQLRNLVELHPEIRVAYTRIVTISTDDLLETNEMRDGLGASWPFLSDPGRIVQKDLDIAEYTDPTHDPMIPYTFVLEPRLRIYSIYNGYWYWGRPSNEDLRRDLREVTRRIRPDWDLGAPGLRDRWEQGARDDFWPYGRSLREMLATPGS